MLLIGGRRVSSDGRKGPSSNLYRSTVRHSGDRKRRKRQQKASGKMIIVEQILNEAVETQQRGDFDIALGLYQRLLDQHSGSLKHIQLCWFNIGVCLTSMGMHRKAKQLYKQVLPQFVPALRNLFALLVLSNDPETGAFLEQYKDALVTHLGCRYNMGLFYFRSKQYRQAVLVFQKLEQVGGQLLASKSSIMLARIYEAEGRLAEAVQHYQRASRVVCSQQLKDYIVLLSGRLQIPLNSTAAKVGRNVLGELKSNNYFMAQDLQSQIRESVKTRQKAASIASTGPSCSGVATSLLNNSYARKPNLLDEFKQPVFIIRPSFLSVRTSSNLHSLCFNSSITARDSVEQAVPEVKSTKVLDDLPPKELEYQYEPAKELIQAHEDLPPSLLEWFPAAPSNKVQVGTPLEKPIFPQKVTRQQLAVRYSITNDFYSSSELPTHITSTNDIAEGSQLGSLLIKKASVTKALTIHIEQDNFDPLQKARQSLYYQAVLLDGLGEYKSAIVRLKKSLNDGVDDRKAVLQLLVSIYRKLDIPEKEVIYLKKLLDYGNKDVYERIQKLYCQINRADKAIQVLKKALNRNLKDPSLFQSIGWLCLRENHIAEGLDYMEKAYSLDTQSKQVRNKLIHALSLAATTKEQCKAILMDAGRQPSPSIDNYLKLVLSYFLESEFDGKKRIELLRKLYSDDNSNNIYLLFAGRASQEAGDIKEAFESFRLSAMHNPRNSKALFELANMYSASNQLDVAEMLLEIVHEEENEDSEVLLTLGNLDFAKRNYSKALKLYKRALHNQPWNFSLLNHIAECYRQTGNYEKALHYFKKSLCLNSKQSDVLLRMAEICRQTDQLDRALKYYDLATELDELSKESLMGHIYCLIQSAEPRRALELLNRIESDDYDVVFARATCEYLTGNYEGAIRLYTQLKLMQQSEDVCFNLGVCHHKSRNYQNASVYYMAVLKSNPSHPQTLFNYGVLLKQLGKDMQGLQFICKAIETEPTDQWILFYAEQLLLEQEYDEVGSYIKHLTKSCSPAIREKGYFLQAKLAVLVRQDSSNIMVKNFSKMFPESRLNGELEHLLEQSSEEMLSLKLVSERSGQQSNVSIVCQPFP